MVSEQNSWVYLDNAATTWPKPPCVAAAINEYMTKYGIGMGRSVGRYADQIRSTIDRLRRDLASLLNAHTDEIILTNSATDGLNLIIQGLLLNRFGMSTSPFAHHSVAQYPALVLTTQIEHNSVLRPLQSWVQRGWIRVEVLPCDRFGSVDWSSLEDWLAQRPLMLCVNHASNVTGVIQSLSGIGQRCRAAGTLFLIDAAQTLGWLPIDVQNLACDFLVAAGHKGLYGPLGTGLAYIRREQQAVVDSLRLGGTGSVLGEEISDLVGPTKWESGNFNVPGLIGLAAAVQARRSHVTDVNSTGTPAVAPRPTIAQLAPLASQLWSSLGAMPEVKLVADPGCDPFVEGPARLPIISLNVANWDNSTLALALDSAAGLVTRAGYHCAPLIHSVLGTSTSGTLRISLGPFNTGEQIVCLRETLEKVCRF
ncbi:MAG: aminotransferase class V-fold PLP-dependent enzyme [Planctomycetaceae bacterium]|nr:aminotransferase class V-fold PLP-dependent enzyme [Planctomycetaceae bacterium]